MLNNLYPAFMLPLQGRMVCDYLAIVVSTVSLFSALCCGLVVVFLEIYVLFG